MLTNQTATYNGPANVVSGPIGNNYQVAPEPCEPSIIGRRAEELVGYLYQLASTQYETRVKLFGPVPSADEGNTKDSRSSIPLDELMARACRMAANLCGEASTICNRL